MNLYAKSSSFVALALLNAPSLLGGLVSSTPSMSSYATGPEQLVVYTDVPGHLTQAPWITVKPGINPQNQIPLKLQSDLFEIRVKSAATNDQWVQCFASYTYNRGSEIEDTPQNGGFNSPVTTQNYQNLTSGWTHTYANVEMTQNSPVEVEISLTGSTPLNGKNFIEKFAVHPFDKATNLSLNGGKIYFTISNPSQVVIDINGQMDDHNAAVNPMAGNPPAHALSFFANPILAKPAASGPGIVSIAPGAAVPDPSTFTTLVFEPGVHQIGLSYPLHPGKSYYIPGDAVLIGTFSNLLSPVGTSRTKGDGIRMFGYGTISGAPYIHYLYPGYIEGPTANSDRTIVIEEGVSCELFGLTIADPFNHSMRFFSWSGSDQPSDKSFSRWMKPITWRANGDGIGGGTDLEDCFLRTADDATYATGNRRRCVFWKDVNAALVHMPDIPFETIHIEDCDVVYNRLRTADGSNGGGFQLRDGGKGVLKGNTIIRNIRFLDKRSNMPAISFNGVATLPTVSTSFSGVTFENISLEPAFNSVKPRILGSATAPWFGGLTMKNVTIGGVLLTQANFDTFFTRNEWVDYILFNDPASFTLTTQATVTQGEIRRDLTQATYSEMSPVVLTAVAKPGETVFSHWSGDASGSTNPLTVWMTGGKTITANFRAATIDEAVVIKDSCTGTWTVPPGVYSATIETWGGGGAGGSAYNGNTSESNTQARGGGGAGGSYAGSTIRVTPGQPISYTVGDGGVAALPGFTHNTAGAAGGTSTAAYLAESVLAQGGPGGRNISVSNSNISGAGGAAPGSGNIGQTIHYGGSGGSANSNGTGGGGGSAGSQGAGGSASGTASGSAGLGGGAAGGSGHNDTEAGIPGATPGAGGSGAGVRSSAFSHRAAGNGGTGQMTVTYNTMSFNLSTSTVGNGTIALDPTGSTFLSGTTVAVTAVTSPGYLFTGWSGALSGTTNPTTVLMDDHRSITATFAADPLAAGVWNGGGTADGLGNFNWSDAANWIVAPSSGGNLTFTGTAGLASFNNLAADTTFTGITFSDLAGSFVLSGNRINLSGDVTNNDAELQTVDLAVILSPTRTFHTAPGDLAMGGVLSGTGGFIKSGSGNLTLSAASTFSGTTAIQNGTIILKGGNDRLPPTSAVTLGVGAPTSTLGILQLGDSAGPVNQTVSSITTPAGDTNRVVGGHENLSTLTVDNSSGTVTFNGSLGGPGTYQNNLALVKTGAGSLALRSVSSLTGPVAIQNGMIEIANGNNRLPTTVALVLGSGSTSGVLQLGNTVTPRSQTVASITTSGTGMNNRVVGAHTTNGPPGFTVNNSTEVIYDGLLGGPTGGQNRMNLTKNGAGTLTLSGASGANTYTGTTVVNQGVLLIHGHSPLTTGAVTVTGGALGGSGTIGGVVSLAAAGSLSPGAPIGTFSTGGLDLSAVADGGSGKLNFQLGPISASDKIVVNGNLTIGPATPAAGILGFGDFNFTGLPGLENGVYKLITGAIGVVGNLDPTAANLTGTIGTGSGQGTLRLTGNDLELLVTGIQTPYQAWADGELFNADANNDGIENGIAWLLGAGSPTSSVNPPAFTRDANGLVMTFSRLNAASRGPANLQVQHSSDLGNSDLWNAVDVPEATQPIPSNGVTFVVSPGDPLDTIVATISNTQSVDGKLFSRLRGRD